MSVAEEYLESIRPFLSPIKGVEKEKRDQRIKQSFTAGRLLEINKQRKLIGLSAINNITEVDN